MLVPQGGAKHWHNSSNSKQEEEETVDPTILLKSILAENGKEGRLLAKALKEPFCEAFSKESAVVKVARSAYFNTHRANFKEEGSHYWSSTFQDMTSSMNLLDTKVHECRRNGLASKSSGLPTRLPRSPKGTSNSLGWLQPLNHPTLWAWRAFICLRPCSGRVAFPSACGVGKRAKMRGQC